MTGRFVSSRGAASRTVAWALMSALPVAASATLLWSAELASGDPFPHGRHQGLFPLCIGCHEGIVDGTRATAYPKPGSCASCHDGVDQVTVDWDGPTGSPSNVAFDHAEHARVIAEQETSALSCETCHTRAGQARMSVEGVELGTCWGCHAHDAREHLTDAECATCHVPLAQSGFGRARIASIEAPEEHGGDGFGGKPHGEPAREDVTRCATCHTRDRCLDCHVNGALEPIPSVPSAPPGMELPATEARYVVPEEHRSPDFVEEHGAFASVAECTTCHTRDDCTACHAEPGPAALEGLVRRADVRAPGARLTRSEPASHASPFFLRGHEALAGSDEAYCQTCHTQDTCTSCHDGATGNEFHPDNFVSLHAAEAYGQTAECANCHNVQAFCRACHAGQGLSTSGRLGGGFHDAEPLWLLRHGQAARQTLETCASCHAQTDCVQCHSLTGAFRINPHGPAFDPDRAREKSARICLACHLSVPGGG